MRIIVVDDERPSRSELCHLIREFLPQAEILEGDSGQAGIELAAAHEADVFFLDIHLGDMAGTALAAMIHRLQPAAKIVFATAYDTYAVKAFDLAAEDYLMKPFDPKRVQRCLEKLCICTRETATEDRAGLPGRLAVSCDKRVVVLQVEDLAYIETDSHGCILHTAQGDFVSPQPLAYYEKRLASYRFFRVHKGYLVNLDYVIELTPWINNQVSVRLRGYDRLNLPVGRRQIKQLRELFEP